MSSLIDTLNYSINRKKVTKKESPITLSKEWDNAHSNSSMKWRSPTTLIPSKTLVSDTPLTKKYKRDNEQVRSLDRPKDIGMVTDFVQDNSKMPWVDNYDLENQKKCGYPWIATDNNSFEPEPYKPGVRKTLDE